MHKKFDHTEIEKKWQKHWEDSGIYDVGERDESKEKEYVLVEWPYPSGNLHVGHWHAFAVPDIYVRAHRMQGRQVLFPMGYDAFGLPAENAAIKRNADPKKWTDENVEHMTKQLRSMGNSFSWDMTASSTDPEYYKWTQWMFTKFFEENIAYRGEGTVNWCPGCNTVIANEQVVDGDKCERSGDVVEKRMMPQWMMRITDYADRLLNDLDTLDWPDHIKESQRQWIGRSLGAEITFALSTGDTLPVFTTRADTLFGATYMVIAPEHPLIPTLLGRVTNREEIENYIKAAAAKTEIERTNADKEKTGVKLEGVIATNPANSEEIPVFVADYALAHYGTGALMAVPAHDERDFEFAEKFKIPVRSVILPAFYNNVVDELLKKQIPYVGDGVLDNSGEFNGMDSEKAKAAITKKVGGKITNTYRLRDWSIGRQRYWGVPIPIVYDPDGTPHAIPEEHLPWNLPTDVDFRPTGEPPLAKSRELIERTEEIFGKGWTPEVETMDTFVDSSWYFLRYIDNKDDEIMSSLEKQKEWMPVDIYFGGAEHNTMHLLYSRFWQKALFDLKLVSVDEPYTKRINRGLVLGPDGNKMSKSKGNVIDPDEHVARLGADTVKMYLAFMGPYGETANYPWDMGGIAGIRRFLERVNGLNEHFAEKEPGEMTTLLHQTIDKVTKDIDQYKFNTAISALMIFLNAAEKEGLSKETYEIFLVLLSVFAPHLAEELWEAEGHKHSIHTELWPIADAGLLQKKIDTLAVQINGKMAGTITLAAGADESAALEAVRKDAKITEKIAEKKIVKTIYVSGRIINILTK